MEDKNFTEVYRDGVNGDICMGVDLEEETGGYSAYDRMFMIEDKSDHRHVFMTGAEAQQLALEILRRMAGKISEHDKILGFSIYGQGGGSQQYKAVLPDGRYAELHVWDEPEDGWLEGAPVLEGVEL